MDKLQQMQADLEAFRASKNKSNIQADLEAFRASKQVQQPEDTTTFGGRVVRSIAKLPARVATNIAQAVDVAKGGAGIVEPFSGEYLGRVKSIGTTGIDETPTIQNLKKNIQESLGAGIEASSYLPITRGAKALVEGVKEPFRKTILGTGKQIAKEGAFGGGTASAGQQIQEKGKVNVGETLLSTGAGGLLGGGLGVVGSGASRLVKDIPVQDIKRRAIDATSKALGISGKKSGGRALQEPAILTQGLANIRKYGEINDNGIKRQFDPNTAEDIFDETLKAWQVSKDKVFNLYDTIARESGEAGLKFDIRDLNKSLNKYISGITTQPTKNKAMRLLLELEDNFPSGKVTPSELQEYIQLLNKELGGVLGGAEKGATEVVADFVRAIREKLDESIQNSTGKAYQQLRDDYASLKAVENALVRQYQKVLRKKGGGLSDYADIISNGDILSGIISANPGLIAKGAVIRGGAKFLRNLNDPSRWLKRAFEYIDKSGDSFVPKRPPAKPKLQLPAPKQGLPQSQNNIPINLGSRPQSVIDAEEISRVQNQLLGSKNTAQSILPINQPIATPNNTAKNISQSLPVIKNKSSKLSTAKELVKSAKKNLKDNPNAGFAEIYKGEKDLTTKILKDLEGKTTVSKQYILDATNRGDLKQVERDLIRRILDESGDTSPLVKEARNYKSAEEFVKAQGTPVYHGSDKLFTTTDDIKFGDDFFYTLKRTDGELKEIAENVTADSYYSYDDLAKMPANAFGENVSEFVVKFKNPKIIDAKGKSWLDLTDGSMSDWTAKIVDQAKKSGEKYDGIIIKNIEEGFSSKGTLGASAGLVDDYIVLDKSALQTKSQLTDIWNKAKSSDTINVSDFAKKVKAELLPLKVKTSPKTNKMASDGFRVAERGQKYESITLPDELRGNVKNYDERIYESPIKTSAGSTHFNGQTDNYFGHTRIEDMADNKTRRVIEVQSDLYQKGNIDKELDNYSQSKYLEDFLSTSEKKELEKLHEQKLTYKEKNGGNPSGFPKDSRIKELEAKGELLYKEAPKKREAEIAKLQQYNDPTAHFRMIREEIKKAAQDGKTKLQFPTGETAMKIEGLGETTQWTIKRFPDDYKAGGSYDIEKLTPEKLKVGERVWQGEQGQGRSWIITDVLGDGKFKAVPKHTYESFQRNTAKLDEPWNKANRAEMEANIKKDFERQTETFDISGKVDTNNPIYKFYEKDVQKYLNKFGGKRVVDDKGVSWIEIPITKEQGKMPVEAFGKAQIGTVGKIGIGLGTLSGASQLKERLSSKPKKLGK